MRRVIAVSMLALAVFLTACETRNAGQDKADAEVVNDQQEVYAQFQPIHTYDYSQVRDSLIQIYDFIVQPQTTYTVVTSNTGTLLFTCDSFGFPLPADTQLTNPLKYVDMHETSSTVEQAEPSGIFSSKNTYGTYVLCVRGSGSITPVYTEGNVTAYPFKVEIVDGVAVDAGGSESFSIEPGASRR